MVEGGFVVEAGAVLFAIGFGGGDLIEGRFEFGRTGLEGGRFAAAAGVGHVFGQGVPVEERVAVVCQPLLGAFIVEGDDGHAVFAKDDIAVFVSEKLEFGVALLLDPGLYIVAPVVDVKSAPVLVGHGSLLQAQCGEVGVVGAPCVIVRGVGAQEVLARFAQFEAVLEKENAAQTETVFALIDRGARAEAGGHDEFGRFFQLLRFEAQVESRIGLNVARIVVNQVYFAVSGAVPLIEAYEGPGCRIAARQVEEAAVFVAVDIDGIETAGVVAVGARVVDGVVVVGFPVVGAQVGEVKLVSEYRQLVLVFYHVGESYRRFQQVALAAFHHGREAGKAKRVFGFHADNAVEGIGAVESRTGTYDEVDLHHVQF